MAFENWSSKSELVEQMKKGLGLEMYLMSWCHFVTFSLREGQTLHIKDIAELSSATQPFQFLHAELEPELRRQPESRDALSLCSTGSHAVKFSDSTSSSCE